jgi:hypothetical protein
VEELNNTGHYDNQHAQEGLVHRNYATRRQCELPLLFLDKCGNDGHLLGPAAIAGGIAGRFESTKLIALCDGRSQQLLPCDGRDLVSAESSRAVAILTSFTLT